MKTGLEHSRMPGPRLRFAPTPHLQDSVHKPGPRICVAGLRFSLWRMGGERSERVSKQSFRHGAARQERPSECESTHCMTMKSKSSEMLLRKREKNQIQSTTA